MSVSINNSITIRDYEIYDDLELVDEKVITNIVNGLFTTTIPDWSDNDPASPYFIRNKPTKTSDFQNDGADGTSRYVQANEIAELGKVDDVQVKLQSQYESVVVDKVAKIDLTSFIRKELKTGSDYLYKVLSDNNFTDNDKNKVSAIQLGGNGNQALTNDGQYKELYNILTINGLTPDAQKNINLTANDIAFGNESVYSILNRSVLYKSSSDKQIVLENNKSLLGKNTLGNELNLIKLGTDDKTTVGSNSAELNLLSSLRPTVNDTNEIAYLSDIESSISAHNTASDTHVDIRNSVTALKTTTILAVTNAQMSEYINSGVLTNGQLVICTDNGIYSFGRVYKFNGTGFDIVTNYQDINLYGNSAPTTSTVGVLNQLYFDIDNLAIYKCNGQSGNDYLWQDITPGQQSIDVSGIINNTTLISDSQGGFTAGNNYRLLDSNGLIPVERIPQSVLRGMIYGGSFDSTGTITGSADAQELTGTLIDNLNLFAYPNYYFLCDGNYTLFSEQYVVGNFALSTGSSWKKVSNPSQVISVNGQSGVVVLSASDVNALDIADANVDVLQNISPITSGNTVELSLTSYNLATKMTSTRNIQLPLANTTQSGLMSFGSYNQLAQNTSAITKLTTSTAKRLIYTNSINPTASDINNFVIGLGYTSPFTGVEVVVNGIFNVWHYYSGTGWVDEGRGGGGGVSNLFTNSIPGIILGSTDVGKISANQDGTGSVNGWNDLVTGLNQMSTDLVNKLDISSTASGNSITLTNSNGDYSFTKSMSSGYNAGLYTDTPNISAVSSVGFAMELSSTSGDFARFVSLGLPNRQSQMGMLEIDTTNNTTYGIMMGSYGNGVVLMASDNNNTMALGLTSTSANINGNEIATLNQMPTAVKTAELSN